METEDNSDGESMEIELLKVGLIRQKGGSCMWIHFFLHFAVQATSCTSTSTLSLAIMEGDETETLGKLFALSH